MRNRLLIKEFQPSNSDIILFDTNILIDLFYPMNVNKDLRSISDLYNRVLKNKSTIALSAVQTSEFINRCIRFQFGLYKKDNPECVEFKKDYRGTEDYTACMDVILDIVLNEWKNKFTFIDDKYESMALDRLFIRGFSYDFNDAILVEIANKYNAVLVTNDKDFMNYSIEGKLVTDNFLLFNSR